MYIYACIFCNACWEGYDFLTWKKVPNKSVNSLVIANPILDEKIVDVIPSPLMRGKIVDCLERKNKSPLMKNQEAKPLFSA